jgi:hypothetical protein
MEQKRIKERTVIVAITGDIVVPDLFGTTDAQNIILSQVNSCILKSVQCNFGVIAFNDNTPVIKNVSHKIQLPSRLYSPDSIGLVSVSLNSIDIPLDSNTANLMNIPIPANTPINYICMVSLAAVATSDLDFETSVIFNFEEVY